MPVQTELIDSSSSRVALFATYREALHRGLLLPVKDNDLSERISRQSTGLPDGRLYRAVAMLERAGRLRVTRTAHILLALPVEDDRWPEIVASPKHLQRVDRWWYHILRLLEAKE